MEVKATLMKEFKPTKIVREQLNKLYNKANEIGVGSLIAIKHKYGRWEEKELKEFN